MITDDSMRAFINAVDRIEKTGEKITFSAVIRQNTRVYKNGMHAESALSGHTILKCFKFCRKLGFMREKPGINGAIIYKKRRRFIYLKKYIFNDENI